MQYQYNDGGRATAGLKGKSGDCSVRAICIATSWPYKQTAKMLKELTKDMTGGLQAGISNGIYLPVFCKFATQMGWELVITKGQYLLDIPKQGVYIASIAGHYVCIKDGIAYDTWDSTKSRRTKCGSPKMEGYWRIK